MLSKKHALLFSALFISLALISSASAETIVYNDPWNVEGFDLTSFDNAGVDVTFSITQLGFENIEIDGAMMKSVQIPRVIIPNDAGAPNLPGDGRFIAIPQGARAEVEIVSYRTEVYNDIDVVPAAPIPLDTDNTPPVYRKNAAVYDVNAYYPAEPVKLSEPTKIRGVDAVILGITPFQYNPVSRELIVYRDLVVRVNFVGGNGHIGEDRLRSRFFESVLQGNLLNYSQLPEVNLHRIVEQTDETNVEYLIIVPDDPVFLAWADTLKQWRKQQGILTGITTLTEIGGNNATLIENYINNAYNTWTIPPVAVLFLSDFQSSGDVYGITSPTWNNYCVSDNMYADVDGNNLPDMIHARICAQSNGQLATMIGKMMTYERTPPTNPIFYDRPLIAGGWQTDRWFILCCEVIWGFLHNELEMNPTREYAIYSGTPGTVWSSNQNTSIVVNYFGPNGLGYIPATPQGLTDWGGNATRINADLNAGAFLLMHRDHGMETGWGEPSYTNSNLTGLTNTDYTFVFSINCLTGKYNYSGVSFAEAFHRMNYGALGLIAASEVSYSFVNDTYVWGMWDKMWPDFDPGYGQPGLVDLKPAIANVYGKHYLAASSWPYNPSNKNHTYHLFHHHGDAFITMYSDIPQTMAVSHAGALLGGATSFTVTAPAGTEIALTVNNTIIGTATGTGSPVALTIAPQVPGTNMLVTITGQNYYRYMQIVPIVPPSGPYVTFEALTLNDAATWMPNGQLDFGETAYINMSLKNIGVETANNVAGVISSTDPYLTIINGSANFGNIGAGAIVTVNNAYQIFVASNVPDDHDISFTMTATSGASVWTSNFVITAHAPDVDYTSIDIDDPAPGGNNNGALDPGETVNFNITLHNSGSSAAQNATLTLSTTQTLITIPTPTVTIANVPAGQDAVFTFQNITASSTMGMGTNTPFNWNLDASGSYSTNGNFSIVVGDIRYTPCGPDAYGYYAYDMYDSPAAGYSWVEIAPGAGGPGQTQTYSDDQTRQFTLPFTFRYYGNNFTQISVCSNGWVAMGSITSTDYSNSQIPNSDGPANMIAAVWDDMNPSTGGQIATYYDANAHRYIVEWYQVPHYGSGGGPETFQVILYDPAFTTTPTGDGNIQVNYHTIANFSSSTHGIENGTQTVGIQFAYNGVLDSHAMPFVNNYGILYTTGLTLPQLSVTLTPSTTPITIPAGGGSFQFTINIQNTGTTPANFAVWTNVTLPNGSVYGPILLRTGINLPVGGSINRTLTQNIPASAPSGNYTYNAYVGGYPSNPIDSDTFPFTKAAGDGVNAGSVNNWSIFGWDVDELVTAAIPQEFFLAQNFPNPFNPVTTISFGLDEDGMVKLEVFNVLGRKVATLADGKMEMGFHSVVWDARELASGVYFYHLTLGNKTEIKKCVLMK